MLCKSSPFYTHTHQKERDNEKRMKSTLCFIRMSLFLSSIEKFALFFSNSNLPTPFIYKVRNIFFDQCSCWNLNMHITVGTKKFADTIENRIDRESISTKYSIFFLVGASIFKFLNEESPVWWNAPIHCVLWPNKTGVDWEKFDSLLTVQYARVLLTSQTQERIQS